MNIEEFEQAYAERSGTTVEWLREHGREAASCHCGSPLCEAFQMVHVKELEWAEERNMLLPEEVATLAEIRERRDERRAGS